MKYISSSKLDDHKLNLKKKILKDLIKSGYPLEIVVLKKLLHKGWKVNPQYHYEDKIEGKNRSVDFISYKLFTLKSKWYSTFRVCLSIECKTLPDKQWVLFTLKNERFNDPIERFSYVNFYEKRLKNTSPVPLIKALNPIHYFRIHRLAVSHYIPFRKKDTLYEALNQSLNALNADKEYLRAFYEKFDYPEQSIFTLYYPMVVCDNNLFEYQTENEELIESDYLIYLTSTASEERVSNLIEIMNVSQFDNILSLIDDEIKYIAHSLGNDLIEQK